MKHINFKTGFSLLLAPIVGDVLIHWGDGDWRAVFTTSGTRKNYEASYINGVAKNCVIESNGAVKIDMRGHGLEPGVLVCTLYHRVDESAKEWKVTVFKPGVELVGGSGDSATEIDVQVVMPYVYVDAYTIASKNGYTGSQAEYFELLGTMEERYVNASGDEVTGDLGVQGVLTAGDAMIDGVLDVGYMFSINGVEIVVDDGTLMIPANIHADGAEFSGAVNVGGTVTVEQGVICRDIDTGIVVATDLTVVNPESGTVFLSVKEVQIDAPLQVNLGASFTGAVSVGGGLTVGDVVITCDSDVLGRGKALVLGGTDFDGLMVAGVLSADKVSVQGDNGIETSYLYVYNTAEFSGAVNVGGGLTVGAVVSIGSAYINIGRAVATDVVIESTQALQFHSKKLYLDVSEIVENSKTAIEIDDDSGRWSIYPATSFYGNVVFDKGFSSAAHSYLGAASFVGAVDILEYLNIGEGLLQVNASDSEVTLVDNSVARGVYTFIGGENITISAVYHEPGVGSVYGMVQLGGYEIYLSSISAVEVSGQAFRCTASAAEFSGAVNVGGTVTLSGDEIVVSSEDSDISIYGRTHLWGWLYASTIIVEHSLSLSETGICLGQYTEESENQGIRRNQYISATVEPTAEEVFLIGLSRRADNDFPYINIGNSDDFTDGIYSGVNIYGWDINLNGILVNIANIINVNAGSMELSLSADICTIQASTDLVLIGEESITIESKDLTFDCNAYFNYSASFGGNITANSINIGGGDIAYKNKTLKIDEIVGVNLGDYIQVDMKDGILAQFLIYSIFWDTVDFNNVAAFNDAIYFDGTAFFRTSPTFQSRVLHSDDIHLGYYSDISKGLHPFVTCEYVGNGQKVHLIGLHDNPEEMILSIGSRDYNSGTAPNEILLQTYMEQGGIVLNGKVYVPQRIKLGGATLEWDAVNNRVVCDKPIVTA